MTTDANGTGDSATLQAGEAHPHGDIDLIQVVGIGLLAFTVLIALMAIILTFFVDLNA
jgi:hypothetical protein